MAWLNYKDLFPRYLISLYIFLERLFFKELLQNSCSKLQPMHHWKLYINFWNPLILQWIWSGTYQLIFLNKHLTTLCNLILWTFSLKLILLDTYRQMQILHKCLWYERIAYYWNFGYYSCCAFTVFCPR